MSVIQSGTFALQSKHSFCKIHSCRWQLHISCQGFKNCQSEFT